MYIGYVDYQGNSVRFQRQSMTKHALPSPAWAEGTVLSLCVCVLPQNCCKIQLSQNLNKLQVTNLVI